MKSDVADSNAMLNSIDQSMGQLTIGTTDMHHKMDATLTKLNEVQTAMPTELGYCWGPEQPILLLDGLGRKTSLPVMFTVTPDVRISPWITPMQRLRLDRYFETCFSSCIEDYLVSRKSNTENTLSRTRIKRVHWFNRISGTRAFSRGDILH